MLCEGVDTLVAALGHELETGLDNALAGFAGEVHVVSDCPSPRAPPRRQCSKGSRPAPPSRPGLRGSEDDDAAEDDGD